MRVTTDTGFEVDLKEDLGNDWEILEIIADMTENDASAVVGTLKLARKLFSKEDYARLKEHCTENGTVLTSRMQAEIMSVFNSINSGKN